MGNPQSRFLGKFENAFKERFPLYSDIKWFKGQRRGNRAGFIAPLPLDLRRGGEAKPNKKGEEFELGDLRTNINGRTLIIEHESNGVPIMNLVKYWPFITDKLTIQCEPRLVICHFSNWESYGTYRHFWSWMMAKMQAEIERNGKKYIVGAQFDTGGNDMKIRKAQLEIALEFISEQCQI